MPGIVLHSGAAAVLRRECRELEHKLRQESVQKEAAQQRLQEVQDESDARLAEAEEKLRAATFVADRMEAEVETLLLQQLGRSAELVCVKAERDAALGNAAALQQRVAALETQLQEVRAARDSHTVA